MPNQEVFSWLRTRFFPHIWCPGCGHGIIMHSILRALVASKKKKSETVIASGIGCSSRMAGYIDACTVHTTHGRSLAFATGIKLAKPELTVIDVMGDGDCTAIGGNHFIHACRRNIDIEPSFDVCWLAEGAGASYVARSTIANPKQAEQFIMNGIKKKGFSVIEIMTHCHTTFGRKNNRRTPIDNVNFFKNNSVPLAKAKEMSEEELAGKIVTGEFVNKNIPEYTEQYLALIENVRGK